MTNEKQGNQSDLWGQDLEGMIRDVEDIKKPRSKAEIKSRLQRTVNQVNKRIKSLFAIVASRFCQDISTRKLADDIEAKALSRATIGDDPNEIILEEAKLDPRIFKLEKQVFDAIATKKGTKTKHGETHPGVRSGQKTLQELHDEIMRYEEELKQVV